MLACGRTGRWKRCYVLLCCMPFEGDKPAQTRVLAGVPPPQASTFTGGSLQAPHCQASASLPPVGPAQVEQHVRELEWQLVQAQQAEQALAHAAAAGGEAGGAAGASVANSAVPVAVARRGSGRPRGSGRHQRLQAAAAVATELSVAVGELADVKNKLASVEYHLGSYDQVGLDESLAWSLD